MWKYLILAVVLSACSTVKPFKVTEEYKKKPFEPKKLALAINSMAIKIENADDVFDDLPANGLKDSDLIYMNFFIKTFDGKVGNYLPTRDYDLISYDSIKGLLEPIKVKFGEKENPIVFDIPKEGTIIKEGTDADIVLIIHDFHIQRRSEFYYSTYGGGSNIYLSQSTRYILWDNRAGKMISMGMPVTESSIFFAMVKKDWENVISAAINQMLTHPPLKAGVKEAHY